MTVPPKVRSIAKNGTTELIFIQHHNINIMKNLILTTTLLLAFTTANVQAQTFIERTHFEVSAGSGIKNHGITPVDFSFKLHVDVIPVLYLFVTAEDNLSLYKNNETKAYVNGASLGGGLGVRLLNHIKTAHALDIRAKSLDSLGKPDWKRTIYDISLAWYMKPGRFSPIVELGYRFLHSHTNSFDNYGNAYLSIGLRY